MGQASRRIHRGARTSRAAALRTALAEAWLPLAALTGAIWLFAAAAMDPPSSGGMPGAANAPMTSGPSAGATHAAKTTFDAEASTGATPVPAAATAATAFRQ